MMPPENTKTEIKPTYEQLKAICQRSPMNKSVETLKKNK
jgi:hypothetical protein